MAKGSVRKKGKKWYYRFYVEDASGNLVQIAYFTGLRLGEVAGLTWQDINLEEQCLTV